MRLVFVLRLTALTKRNIFRMICTPDDGVEELYVAREVYTWVLQGRHLYCHSQATHSSGEDYPMYLLWNWVGSPWFPSSNAFPLGGNELLKGDTSMLLQHKVVDWPSLRDTWNHLCQHPSILAYYHLDLSVTSPSVNNLHKVQHSSGWYVGRFIPIFQRSLLFPSSKDRTRGSSKTFVPFYKAHMLYPGRQSSNSVFIRVTVYMDSSKTKIPSGM